MRPWLPPYFARLSAGTNSSEPADVYMQAAEDYILGEHMKASTSRRNSLYSEGDWLWIPLLESGSHAVGRIARVGPSGRALTIYAFGPPRTEIPGDEVLGGLKPSTAALVGMSGDLGIVTGEWIVLPSSVAYDREKWPMPVFGEWDDPLSPGRRVVYPEGAPNTQPVESVVPYEEARKLPRDGLYGHVGFEAVLAVALGIAVEPDGSREDVLAKVDHYVYFGTERVAKSAAVQMIKAVPGASISIQASGEKWLVRLTHRVSAEALTVEAAADRLTRIALQRKGEYDGWEADA